jgi:hypothetical protein
MALALAYCKCVAMLIDCMDNSSRWFLRQTQTGRYSMHTRSSRSNTRIGLQVSIIPRDPRRSLPAALFPRENEFRR